ncbi:MAG TPA: hypothetical protein VIM51_10190 [Desulfosporosinus sp.]
MNFANGMTCEIMISNGTFTVGYVNGKPAEWVGNNKLLTHGVNFRLIKDEGSTIIFSKQKFRCTGNYGVNQVELD